MSNFVASEIQTILNHIVDKYNDKISQEFKINKDKLKRLWETTTEPSDSEFQNPFKMIKTGGINLSRLVSCDYVYCKGERVGEKCKNPCQDGKSFCSIHRFQERMAAIQPSASIIIPGAAPFPTRLPSNELLEPRQQKYSPFKVSWSPEIKRLVHIQTNMVCKSESEFNVIIGKKIGSQIGPLSKEDMKTLAKFSMTYEPDNKKWTQNIDIDEETDLSLVGTDQFDYLNDLDPKDYKMTTLVHNNVAQAPVISLPNLLPQKRSIEGEEEVPTSSSKKRNIIIEDEESSSEEDDDDEIILSWFCD